jgi:hypothetical protein
MMASTQPTKLQVQMDMDLYDSLTAHLQQLHAFLAVIYGEGGPSFRNTFSGNIQDSYLWGCAELAKKCVDIASQIESPSQG